MNLHPSVPPPYNNLFQSAPPIPLQRSQSLQFNLPPVPSNFHPLNATQQLQPGHGFAQQHFLQQQQQQQQQRALATSTPSHVAPAFAPHRIQRPVHPPTPFVPVPQHPAQQSYSLPIHHGVSAQQPIATTQVPLLDNQTKQLQPGVNPQLEKQQYEPKPDAHLEGLKLVPDPPDLEKWRQRLFDVGDMIVVSEEQ
jgi:glutathione S-transferase